MLSRGWLGSSMALLLSMCSNCCINWYLCLMKFVKIRLRPHPSHTMLAVRKNMDRHGHGRLTWCVGSWQSHRTAHQASC